MKAKDREQSAPSAENARLGKSASAAIKDHGIGRGGQPGDALARARALARWENEGGRVAPAAREQPVRR